MAFIIAKRTFRPALWPTLVTLLLLPLLLGLGIWQWQRAEQKQSLQQHFHNRLNQPAIALQQLDQHTLAEQLYRQVTVTGYYDTVQQVLLDNQIKHNQAGYLVLTPLRLQHSDAAILVNRGWLAAGRDRSKRPDLSLDTQTPNKALISIQGRIGRVPNPGILLDNGLDQVSLLQWPLRLQHVNYQELAEVLGYPLLPVVLLLDPDERNGYLREWQPNFGGLGPERHIGYAVQWCALALTLIIIYLVMTFRKPEKA